MSFEQPEGYLALPENQSGKAILVLHAWWGLNETIRKLCNRLAFHGFTTFAPDLYQGRVTDQINEAEILSSELFNNVDQTRKVVAEAAEFLKKYSLRKKNGIAVIGFSLGAFFALDLSICNPDSVHAVVVYYGTRPGDYSQTQAAYLGHFAESDEFEPEQNVNLLEAALREAGRPASIFKYKNTGHWFFEPDRIQAYDKKAADLSWERTLEFLEQV